MHNRTERQLKEEPMIASNTQESDDHYDINICMGACLNECMRNGSRGLSKITLMLVPEFITYDPTCNHAVMH